MATRLKDKIAAKVTESMSARSYDKLKESQMKAEGRGPKNKWLSYAKEQEQARKSRKGPRKLSKKKTKK